MAVAVILLGSVRCSAREMETVISGARALQRGETMMALPQTMKQVRFSRPGGPEVIEIETAPVPQPGAGQVLIAVAAAGIHFPGGGWMSGPRVCAALLATGLALPYSERVFTKAEKKRAKVKRRRRRRSTLAPRVT